MGSPSNAYPDITNGYPSDGDEELPRFPKGTTAMGCIFNSVGILVAVDHSLLSSSPRLAGSAVDHSLLSSPPRSAGSLSRSAGSSSRTSSSSSRKLGLLSRKSGWSSRKSAPAHPENVTVSSSRKSAPAYPENVIVLDSNVLVAFSGGSTQSKQFLLSLPTLERKHGEKVSATKAAKWLTDFLLRKPDSNDSLSLGILIAGWDNESGPALYTVNGKGELVNDNLVGIGSGFGGISVLVHRLNTMSKAEATEEAKAALCLGVYYAPERGEYFSSKFFDPLAIIYIRVKC
ncbi:OLC1v1006351C2 [Oldenlandia corymbosa var. corymbosa]|uniref:OLC1v1006351C2 n=1 Tax=Oldenlandia corymbosa var. corymbosa TaxID=529605 RepID=A0AAV1DJ54_OLDCO|nr:OLC1v1006351C2 [Oldenlandia corymbosa var. corymbosa]